MRHIPRQDRHACRFVCSRERYIKHVKVRVALEIPLFNTAIKSGSVQIETNHERTDYIFQR